MRTENRDPRAGGAPGWYRRPAFLCIVSAALLAPAAGTEAAGGPSTVLVVDPGLVSCGVFQDYRSLELEHELKCRLTLRAGRWDLPLDSETIPVDLIESVEFGPGGEEATPVTPGILRRQLEPPQFCAPGATCYRLTFEQDWTAGGVAIRVRDFNGFYVRVVGGVPDPAEIKLSKDRLYYESWLYGSTGPDPEDYVRNIRFASCDYQELPLWEVRVELEGGHRALLHERYQVPMAGSGPAQIVRGEVWLGEHHVVETSYWKIVYAADHHNWNERYWVLFDEPIVVDGVPGVTGFFVQEGFIEEPRRAALIGTNHEEIKELEILSYEQVLVPEPPLEQFKRGDAARDGKLDLSDPVAILSFLFLGGVEPCTDSSDVDDSGSLDITDPIALLEFLFLGGDSPAAPYPGCGADPTADELEPCSVPCTGD